MQRATQDNSGSGFLKKVGAPRGPGGLPALTPDLQGTEPHARSFVRQLWFDRGPGAEPHRASPPTTGTDLPSRGGRPRAHARARTVMILPQVHLRKPCYDFYFIDPRQIKGLSRNGPRVAPRSRTGPTFSWTRTLCSSDGRCVQRAGT